ncbi:MAG TPA: FKBP-type peptidyl-prolyl cis-trans isomerase [Dyadobacter sp.]|nr:FKBP-type peptidyl-prolyl cis-trans isomerase [Dyadobacter sp.]
MGGKFLKAGIWVAAVVGMVSCLNKVDTNDEKKIAENEAAIEKYLQDSSLTDKVTRESTGLIYYKRTTNPSGELAKTGDAATVKVMTYLLNGTKVPLVKGDSSVTFPVDGFATDFFGLEFGVKTLRTGEKASYLLPFYLAFGSGASSAVPAYSPIRMEMEFLKTRTEVQQINEYIAAKQYIPSERSTDNLVLIRTNTVTGDTLGSGKSVSVKYIGRLLNGTKFDEGTIPHTTNAGGSITGFDRAIRKMRKGEKAIVIFPSALGYGKNGRQGTIISPYSPLQFELEIVP